MKTLRAFKSELDLNNKQKTASLQHAGAARFAYNWGLARKCHKLHERRNTYGDAFCIIQCQPFGDQFTDDKGKLDDDGYHDSHPDYIAVRFQHRMLDKKAANDSAIVALPRAPLRIRIRVIPI
jgi:hypothetical protein